MTWHSNADFGTALADGVVVPVRTVAQCRVCCSKHRLTIERALLSGTPPKAVVDQLPRKACVSARNVKEHLRRGHVPTDHGKARRLADEAARELGRDVVGPATLREAVRILGAQQVVTLSMAALVSGVRPPTIREGIAAAKFLRDVDQAERAAERQRSSVESQRHLLGLGVADLFDRIAEHVDLPTLDALCRCATWLPGLDEVMSSDPLKPLRGRLDDWRHATAAEKIQQRRAERLHQAEDSLVTV